MRPDLEDFPEEKKRKRNLNRTHFETIDSKGEKVDWLNEN